MNSAFADLFLALQQHVQEQVTDILYIDQDLGQLNPGTDIPITFPCLLIDFEDFKFDNLGENVQTAEGTVLFKLGFTSFSASDQSATEESKEAALAFYDIEWALHKALQGWVPTDFAGHLIRNCTLTQKRTDMLRVRELRYSLAFEDYSTKYEQLFAAADIEVRPEMDLD